MTEHSLKKRFIKYMSEHYSRMSTKDVESLLEEAIHRLTKTTHFNRGLLAEVIQEMTEEGQRVVKFVINKPNKFLRKQLNMNSK